MPATSLLIGNKNYSSWSLRPWLVMKMFDIPFEEKYLRLYESNWKSEILKTSPSGKVPALNHEDVLIWDSLAICEYLAETFPEKNLWPQNPEDRAMARSICAEMHSGFTEMRMHLSMNIKARHEHFFIPKGAYRDVMRIQQIWSDCLAKAGSEGFLFGPFTIADAFYAPVVYRFKTYAVHVDQILQNYMSRIENLPPMKEWVKAALQEAPMAVPT